MKFKCFWGFHNWSDWIKNKGVIYAYRYCFDCGIIEFNWLKWGKRK